MYALCKKLLRDIDLRRATQRVEFNGSTVFLFWNHADTRDLLLNAGYTNFVIRTEDGLLSSLRPSDYSDSIPAALDGVSSVWNENEKLYTFSFSGIESVFETKHYTLLSQEITK